MWHFCLYSLPASVADLRERPHPLVKFTRSATQSRAGEQSHQIKKAWLEWLPYFSVEVCVWVTLEVWSSTALVSLLEPDDIISFTTSLRCSPHIYTRALALRWAGTHTFKAHCAANCYLCYQQGVCASVFFGFTLDELGSIKIYSWSTVLHAWALSSFTAWMQMMRISWGLASVIITVAFTLGLRIFQNPWHGQLCCEYLCYECEL